MSLRERALGKAEGLTWQQLSTTCPAAMVAIQRDDGDPNNTHGVEALGVFRQRAVRALMDIAAAHPGMGLHCLLHSWEVQHHLYAVTKNSQQQAHMWWL